MKHTPRTDFVSKIALVAVMAVATSPVPAHADATTALLAALFGTGTSTSTGQYINGDPSTQVIPLLQQNYRQSVNNGGANVDAIRLQTETQTKISTYQEQNQWERERRLRDEEIAARYGEMSNLSCAVATANQSAPVIDIAARNAIGAAVDILSSGMYRNVLLATEISADYKAQIWCKLGATGVFGTCKTEADPLIRGADQSHTAAITRKDSIPCDMQGVSQEFERMRDPKNWTPTERHKECVAAILSIANEFPVSNSLPTEKEAGTVMGKKIWDRKINQIAMAAGSKGGIFEKFEDRVSVPSSNGCMRGIQGGGDDMWNRLKTAYGSSTRQGSGARPPFGMPPDGFCLSRLQFRLGQLLLIEANKQEQSGRRNQIQIAEDTETAIVSLLRTQNDNTRSLIGATNTGGMSDMDMNVADRAVRAQQDNHEELMGAIRQLTNAIQMMNTGVYAGKAQEVRMKKAIPAIKDKAAEISDALKELGIKVSAAEDEPAHDQPAAYKPGVLGPITTQFPVLPPE